MKILCHRTASCLPVVFLCFAVFPARAQRSSDPVVQLHEEFNQADAELNKVYQALLAKLNSEGKKKLRESERAWLVFREAEAAFCSSQGNGSFVARCNAWASMKDTTEQRIKQLRGNYPE